MNSIILSITIFLKTIVSPASLDVKVDQVLKTDTSVPVSVVTSTVTPKPRSVTPAKTDTHPKESPTGQKVNPKPTVEPRSDNDSKKPSSNRKASGSKHRNEANIDAINKNFKKFLDARD